MAMITVAFPNDTAVIAGYASMLTDAGLDSLFSSLDLNAPGWLFWVSLMGSAYTYFVVAVASIKIGSKLFPTSEEHALELITSSPKRGRSYFAENILSAILALFLIFLPSFLILSIYSLTQDAADSIPRLGVMYLFSMAVCLFFVAITSLLSVFRFSQGTGSKIGYIYLIFAFMIELGAGSVEEYKDLMKISVNSYLAPTSGLLSGEHRWSEFGVVLAICAILFIIGYYWIKRPDYIEKVSAPKKSRLGFLPRFSPRGKMAYKYPLLFDQFRTDRSIFFIWMIIVNIVLVYVIFIYQVALGDDPMKLVEMMSSFETMMKAFTLGHAIEASYMGFLSFELFGLSWMYFGVFLFIPAINIPNRDQKRDEQDLLWSNSVTPEWVIISRTASLFIFFSIFYWLSFGVLTASSLGAGMDFNTAWVANAFLVGYIYYTGLIFLLIGIAMLFPVSKGKRYALWFYVISIIFLLTGFMVESAEFLKYLSIVYYYDPVGLIFDKVDLIGEILKSALVLAGSLSLYIAALKLRFRKVDLLS